MTTSEQLDTAAERLLSLELAADDAKDVGGQLPEAEVDELMSQLVASCPSQRLLGLKRLRLLTTGGSDVSFGRLLDSPSAMKAIVDSLEDESDADTQLEAVWALTNLLAGGEGHADAVGKSGAVAALLRLLTGQSARLQEQACWALCNLLGESAGQRDAVLAAGLLEALLRLSRDQEAAAPGLQEALALLLVSVFRQRDRCNCALADHLLPLLLRLVDGGCDAAVPNALWAIAYFVEDSRERIILLLHSASLPRIRRRLDSDEPSLLVPALSVFGHISTVIDRVPDSVLADGLLERMRDLLKHHDERIRRQILFFLGNITDGPNTQLQQVVDADLIPAVADVLLHSGEAEQRAAFWVVPNFCISRPAAFMNLMVEHCLDGFLKMLQLRDTELTHCILLTVRQLLFASRYRCADEMDFDALKKKLETIGGWKRIELVQQTAADEELCKMSSEIIDQFRNGNEEKYMNSESLCEGDSVSSSSSEETGHEDDKESNNIGSKEVDEVS